jgi:hypothetical protein
MRPIALLTQIAPGMPAAAPQTTTTDDHHGANHQANRRASWRAAIAELQQRRDRRGGAPSAVITGKQWWLTPCPGHDDAGHCRRDPALARSDNCARGVCWWVLGLYLVVPDDARLQSGAVVHDTGPHWQPESSTPDFSPELHRAINLVRRLTRPLISRTTR